MCFGTSGTHGSASLRFRIGTQTFSLCAQRSCVSPQLTFLCCTCNIRMLTGFRTPRNVPQTAARRALVMQRRVTNPLGAQANGSCSEYEVDSVPFLAALYARSDQQVLDFASRRCKIPTR